jgi:uncharacterized repeat protein (TIGR03803 family)
MGSDVTIRTVLPMPDGTVLAMTSRPESVDTQCDLVRVASGVATLLHTFSEACGTSGQRRQLKADSRPDSALGFAAQTFLVGPTGAVIRLPQPADLPVSTHVVLDMDRSADGSIWGVTTGGGFGAGTVFRIPASGTWTTVATLPAGNREGAEPVGPLVADADGYLYGAARAGGLYERGTIFRVSKDGRRFDVLYTFAGGSDGGFPNALVRARDGALYGTTSSGANHYGTSSAVAGAAH